MLLFWIGRCIYGLKGLDHVWLAFTVSKVFAVATLLYRRMTEHLEFSISRRIFAQPVRYMGIYKKKNRPFNHIFGGDRILRAWYRGIKNAGPRKRAQGRAQDIPYQPISPYHHAIWRIFIECGKKNPRAQERARAKRKGSYPTKKQQEFSTTPIYIYNTYIYIIFISKIELQSFSRDIMHSASIYRGPISAFQKGEPWEVLHF